MRDIVSRIDALSELINDLMVFARPRPLRLAVVELRPLLQDAITMVRRDPAADSIDFSVSGDEVAAVVDSEMIRATVLNLLLNAAQAMGGRGRIQILVERQGDSASIQIRDSGPGIPPELNDQVFEPFFTTKARGGGLGLPIARRTAELHGGTLTLEPGEQGGTVATLVLPIRLPSHATA
jgi:signal transduction histidine kinase